MHMMPTMTVKNDFLLDFLDKPHQLTLKKNSLFAFANVCASACLQPTRFLHLIQTHPLAE